jgi:crossover junction endodeoxyribonuclease RuvC
VRGLKFATVRVLGIDPGSQCTGFGVVDCAGPKLIYVASGVIRTPDGQFADRLCEIFRGVQTVVAQYQPHEIAIERVFVNRNPDSALKLGQARGAAICGTVDAHAEVFEYATRQIKQAVVPWRRTRPMPWRRQCAMRCAVRCESRSSSRRAADDRILEGPARLQAAAQLDGRRQRRGV